LSQITDFINATMTKLIFVDSEWRWTASITAVLLYRY